MKKNEILLSGGSIPWHGLRRSIRYIKDIGYDGIEIVPSRNIISEIKNTIRKYGKDNWQNHIQNLNLIKSLHQNWRLDMGLDTSYGIEFPMTIFFIILRFILFPRIKESNETIKSLLKKLKIPIVVHDLSSKWTKDNANREFLGEILYEIMGTSMAPGKLKSWMEKENHNIAIDSRDDQSLLWGKKYGHKTWQDFWKWIGIEKIKNLQLTLIGIKGLRKIMNHQNSLPEEQLLWLNRKKWNGKVTVEVNPLTLLFLCKGDMKKGFIIIRQFIRRTLVEGKKWS